VGDLKKIRHLVAALIVTVVPSVVMAANAKGTLGVSLAVLSACNVRTRPIGNAGVADLIGLSCTKDTPAAVYVDGELVPMGTGEKQISPALRSGGKRLSAQPGQAAMLMSHAVSPSARQLVTADGRDVIDVVY
jgi:hypothetical protein